MSVTLVFWAELGSNNFHTGWPQVLITFILERGVSAKIVS